MAGGRRGDGRGPFWGDLTGPNPTDRAKKGAKRGVLVEANGGPPAAVIAGANVRDDELGAATLDAVVTERPEPTEGASQQPCLDEGYDNEGSREIARERGYVAHIRRIGEEKLDGACEKRYPARRWVVERLPAWRSKCRGILVRYETKAANYLGLVKVACILLWYRRQRTLSLRDSFLGNS